MAFCCSHNHQQQPSLLACVCRSKLYVLLVACFLFSLGLSIILPALPDLSTNYFASQHAGQPTDCEEFSLDDQPPACQAAHADVVRWASLNSLVANTFLGFIFAPLVGDLSDRLGRKPFMLAGITLAVLPVGAVWMHITHSTSFIWYYPFNALTAVVAPIICFLSYTADVLRPELRTSGFGLVTASFGVAFCFGPTMGGILGPARGAVAAMGAMVVSFLLIAAALPESRRPKPPSTQGLGSAPSGTAAAAAVLSPSPATVATAAARRRRPLDALKSIGRSWALVNSSSLFRRLALCMAVVGIVSEGINDMLLQYLQLVIGFNTMDQAVLITVLGAGSFVVQALLLPFLTKLMGERRLLVFGLLFSIMEQALLSLAVVKWQAIAAVSLSAFAGVSFPAISSLKSTHARADQQGLVQGALAGIRAVAAGVGPLGLAQLFAMSTAAEAALGYKPSIVFWTTCALTVVAAAVAATIPADAAKIPQQQPGEPAAARAGGAEGHSYDSSDRHSSALGAGAWLGDEEAAWCEACKVRGCAGKAPRGVLYHPPALQERPRHCKQEGGGGEPVCVLVVVESPASDSESVFSDQLQLRDQTLPANSSVAQGEGRQHRACQPQSPAWQAAEAGGDEGASSSSSSGSPPSNHGLREPLLSGRD